MPMTARKTASIWASAISSERRWRSRAALGCRTGGRASRTAGAERRGGRGPRLWLAAIWLWASAALAAETVYLAPERFLEQAFEGRVPAPSVLWLTGDLRQEVEAILGHPADMLRTRYWQRDGRSAWILEEIGKERPITVGVVIEGGRIERLEVLIYRESRGYEVHRDGFEAQFEGGELTSAGGLDRRIDGISGATLSVRALTRIARLALRLDKEVAGG